MRKLITPGLLFSLLMLALTSAPMTAGTSAQDNTEIQYAAKFVCGKSGGDMAAPGEYFTTINVHNPSPSATVDFRKKFALALGDEQPGRITKFFPVSLKADEAMGIDCSNIYKHTNLAPGTFIEGYAVILTPAELDVVSVYTAGSPVSTLHTERVLPRRVPLPCKDLNLNLGTGAAPWQVTQDMLPFTNEPRTASIVTSHPSGWVDQTGAQWIGLTNNADGAQGTSTYEFCFCMCSGFSNAKLTLKGMADEKATVYLNGVALSPAISSFSTPAVVQTSNQQLFKEGTNCLKVVVNNTTTFTGLSLAGSVTATAGGCP